MGQKALCNYFLHPKNFILNAIFDFNTLQIRFTLFFVEAEWNLSSQRQSFVSAKGGPSSIQKQDYASWVLLIVRDNYLDLSAINVK